MPLLRIIRGSRCGLVLAAVLAFGTLAGIVSLARAQVTYRAASDQRLIFPVVLKAGFFGTVPVPTGLVGWWSGDAGADDISCNNYNGTWQGGVNVSPGKVSNAFDLDGVRRYVLIPDTTTGQAPDLLDPTAAATLVAWVYFRQRPSDVVHFLEIVSKSGGGTDLDLQAQDNDDRFYFYVASGYPNVVASQTAIQPGQWYFVAATYTANGALKMYVNGALESTKSIPGVTRAANGNPVTIGASYVWPGRYLNGLVDEAQLFSRALTASEIQGIYNAGSFGEDKSAACT